MSKYQFNVCIHYNKYIGKGTTNPQNILVLRSEKKKLLQHSRLCAANQFTYESEYNNILHYIFKIQIFRNTI